MTREEAFKEINETQDYYVNELAKMIDDPNRSSFRYINFTSPTGTGKTKMMAKLMNLMPKKIIIILIIIIIMIMCIIIKIIIMRKIYGKEVKVMIIIRITK